MSSYQPLKQLKEKFASNNKQMKIPIEELNSDTLYALAESFVLREGTDYGEQEVSLKEKVEQVLKQLKSGDAILLYSELHETVDIVPKSHLE